MYESKKHPPLTQSQFVQRVLNHVLGAIVLLAASLGGMGPVNAPQSDAGKLFAGLYAMYAGLVFIVTGALLFTLIMHRVLHRFHWSE